MLPSRPAAPARPGPPRPACRLGSLAVGTGRRGAQHAEPMALALWALGALGVRCGVA